jgi:hypothetical protein
MLICPLADGTVLAVLAPPMALGIAKITAQSRLSALAPTVT